MNSVNIAKTYIGPIIGCLTLVVVVLVIIKAPAIKRQLNDWKLLPQPERLSELYYQNNSHLPTTYTPGVAQQFSFTVHNLEYRPTAYNYQVIEQANNNSERHVLASGSFSLAQNKYQTTNLNISPIDLGSQVEITTLLHMTDDSDETIHYYATQTGGTGI